VRLGTPVTRIEHGLGGIRAVTEKGTVEARAVLVAASPVMASRIAFSPPLPDALVAALGAWQGGTVIKIVVRYSRAFWRDKGLSGMVMWRDVPGL
ncbi:FAD-dependent oxidoreductase, partial [Mesorhizobium sp. M8A.F.Ca.ET.165.01.1.1]|uniref:FAD-dependent oxidoreductase n=1 Tax=Mesorhizobium sp. M8A.F.Ca.ET.165.01.1.1 TaxID=2563960 RepID=UPI001133AB1B